MREYSTAKKWEVENSVTVAYVWNIKANKKQNVKYLSEFFIGVQKYVLYRFSGGKEISSSILHNW